MLQTLPQLGWKSHPDRYLTRNYFHCNVLERDLYGASRGIQGSKSGLENGLRLLMDMETFDDAHHSWWVAKLHADHPSLRKSAGLVMALSENLERPLMSQLGNYVAPGTATLLAFKVEKSVKSQYSLGYSNWHNWGGNSLLHSQAETVLQGFTHLDVPSLLYFLFSV